MRFARWVLTVVIVLALAGGLIFYLNPLWVVDQQTRWHLWREGVKSAYVEAGGYQLHYFEAGSPSGIPLLLVHGLGARGEDWRAMIPAMAEAGFHVYVPDLPGYGRSSKPANANYSIAMEEAAVVAFAKAVHISQTNLGGWSMGGWVSMKLALDHPELVDRLVIYDSAGIYFPADFGAELFLPEDAPGVTRLMKVLSPHPGPMPNFVMRAVLRKIAGNGWVLQRSMAEMKSGRDLLDFRLQGIRQPTLVVWGSEDELIPLSVGKKLHDEIPNSSLVVIDGCGHLAPLECSEPVVRATQNFLRTPMPVQGSKSVLASH